VKNSRYLIDAESPVDSLADVALELYTVCDGKVVENQDHTFSPGVQLEFVAPDNGAIFVKLSNSNANLAGDNVRYELSVRQLSSNTTGNALILVAGAIRDKDPVQPNIYHVIDGVRQLFIDQGYSDDRIQYLAPDTAHAHVDAAATAAELQKAITTWAASQVNGNGVLTIYMMDHGDRETLYLNKPQGQSVTTSQLNDWLNQLETAYPGLKVNIIIEACYAGSFVSAPTTLSKAGRVVITSTSDSKLAWASDQGAIFSDYLLLALGRKLSLYTSFQRAQAAARTFHPEQDAWFDANGDSIPNQVNDQAVAAQRGFDLAGTLGVGDEWPPYIAQAEAPTTVDQGVGTLRAQVLDDVGVRHVWATIYPPSYTPPAASDALVRDVDNSQITTIKLQDSDGDGWFTATYNGFAQFGHYRILLYAEDDQSLTAQPVALTLDTGTQLFLPIVQRGQ
jgi:hypothetical protein